MIEKIRENIPLIIYCVVKSYAAFWFLMQFLTWGTLAYNAYDLVPNLMTDFLPVWLLSAAFAMQLLYAFAMGYLLFGLRRERFVKEKKKPRGRNGR